MTKSKIVANDPVVRHSVRVMKGRNGPKILGRHIVADPKVCHGEATFRGTRIMVRQVLAMVAEGLAWETIVERCHRRVTEEAIAEAVTLSSAAFPNGSPHSARKPSAWGSWCGSRTAA